MIWILEKYRSFKSGKQNEASSIHSYPLIPPLKKFYMVYQWLLQAYKNNDFERFISIVVLSKKNDPTLSKVMRNSLRTLHKHLEEIEHTLCSSFSNGPLEGLNNKIENIK